MYKQIETEKVFYLDNGETNVLVATLADEHGGKCQIAIDDHCYVLYLKQSKPIPTEKVIYDIKKLAVPNEYYKQTAWIFPEAFEVLKTLPSLKGA